MRFPSADAIRGFLESHEYRAHVVFRNEAFEDVRSYIANGIRWWRRRTRLAGNEDLNEMDLPIAEANQQPGKRGIPPSPGRWCALNPIVLVLVDLVLVLLTT